MMFPIDLYQTINASIKLVLSLGYNLEWLNYFFERNAPL
jgi:hypothetical protein